MRSRVVVNGIRVFATFATIIYIVYRRQTSNSVKQTAHENTKRILAIMVSKKIVLVIVVCPPPGNFSPRDEATVLLKSVIISAKLNKISTIEVYFFVENIPREKLYFRNKINVSD